MKRILLKISGETLSSNGKFVEKESINSLVREIKEGIGENQLGIVLGGGNFWRGRDNESLEIFRGKSDHVGMLATVMNALIFAEFLKKNNFGAKVFSARSMPSFCEEFSLEKVEKAFSENKICLFAGGTGSPFFTTDSASALRAIEIKANIYAKATTVDGVYSTDPNIDKNAFKYDKITFSEVIKNNLKVMDTSAFALCQENNLSIQVFNGKIKGNITKVLKGDEIGTIIS